MQNADDLNRGIAHAIKDDVRLDGDRTNASEQLVARSPGMRPLRECLARPINKTKLLVSNVGRRLARYKDPNGKEILLGLGRPIDRELTLSHIGRERG